jgi:hypothetical protein
MLISFVLLSYSRYANCVILPPWFCYVFLEQLKHRLVGFYQFSELPIILNRRLSFIQHVLNDK